MKTLKSPHPIHLEDTQTAKVGWQSLCGRFLYGSVGEPNLEPDCCGVLRTARNGKVTKISVLALECGLEASPPAAAAPAASWRPTNHPAIHRPSGRRVRVCWTSATAPPAPAPSPVNGLYLVAPNKGRGYYKSSATKEKDGGFQEQSI